MKNVLSFALAVVFVIGVCFSAPFTLKANAASVSVLTFTYNSYSNSYSVTDCIKGASGKLVIPSKYNGLPVRQINRDAFNGCTLLTSITIPESVVSIDRSVFMSCRSIQAFIVDISNPNYSSLDGVLFNKEKNELVSFPAGKNVETYIIPEGVISVGEYAFRGCNLLETIKIPETVTSIGTDAFYGTGCYKNSSNWENDVLYIDNYLIKAKTKVSGDCIIKESTKHIAYKAFERCSSLKSVTIPDSVIGIGDFAFDMCTSLTSVKIDNGTRTIGAGAFRDCSSLAKVEIPESVNIIGDSAFYGCESLVSITIPDNSIKIGKDVFLNTGYYNDGNNWYDDVLYIGNHLIEAKKSISGNYFIKSGTTSICGYAFYKCSLLASLTIPDSVIYIGDYALWGNSALTSITFSSNIKHLGLWSFYGCTLLQNIIIPDSVTSIGDNAFDGCSSLTSVTIPDSVTSIGSGAFDGCTSLTNIVIPDSVASIGNSAFYGCESLISIVIPDSVKSVGNLAFSWCSSLESVTLGSGVTSIGDRAFFFCDSLASVNITDLASWCELDFDYSSTPLRHAGNLYLNGKLLTELVIPEGITEIKPYTFCNRTSLTSVIIPDSVTSIGDYAFDGCTSLTSVIIPESVNIIGDSAFYDCESLVSVDITDLASWCNIDFYDTVSNPLFYAENLYFNGELVTNIVIPEGIKEIKNYAFYNCSKLTSVTIPDSVTSVGDSAFWSCDSLATVTIPDNVTNIGSSAFKGCSSLTRVTIPDSVTSIGDETFSGCDSLVNITLPNSVTSIGESAFSGCDSLVSVTIPNRVTTISEYLFRDCRSLTSVIMPDSITSIGYEAFHGCTALENITLPEKLTSIGVGAFKYCQYISSIRIPNSVESINRDAFYGCDALDTVYINDLASWCNIDFGNLDASPLCSASKLFLNGELVTDLVIPDSVTSIGYAAFYSYDFVKTIKIPDSVTSIGRYAFGNCPSLASVTLPVSVNNIESTAFEYCDSLKYVFYEGSLKEWNEINISDNSSLTLASIHYNATDHSHELSINKPSNEGLRGSIEDICSVCGFFHQKDTLVYLSDYITAIDSANVRIDTTSNSLVVDLLPLQNLNEAIIEMDGYTLTTTPNSDYGYYGTGSKVQVADSTGTQVAEYTLVVRGDVNGDSVCDVLDCMLIELARNNHKELDGVYLSAGDLTENGSIDVYDFEAVVNKAIA